MDTVVLMCYLFLSVQRRQFHITVCSVYDVAEGNAPKGSPAGRTGNTLLSKGICLKN